jgi:electron transfer flavoprotein beta subunit
MRARKKPMEDITLADLGVKVTSRTRVLALEPPPKRKAGVRVSSVEGLVDKLKNEAKVI